MRLGQRETNQLNLRDGKLFYPSDNRYRPVVITNCANCKAEICHDKRHGKSANWFCNTKCYYQFNDSYVDCDHCGITLVRHKSKRSALNFCDRSCKEAEQRIGGKLELAGYKDGRFAYRSRAISHYGLKCSDCNESKNHRLVVHHIDGDRSNNKLDNLIVLCHNHHSDRHAKSTNGMSVLDYKNLT